LKAAFVDVAVFVHVAAAPDAVAVHSSSPFFGDLGFGFDLVDERFSRGDTSQFEASGRAVVDVARRAKEVARTVMNFILIFV
jgi:hypothetical protein